MRPMWAPWLLVGACAARTMPSPAVDYDHPLAARGVADGLREAADRVDARDYAGAQSLLEAIVPPPVDPETAARDAFVVAAMAWEEEGPEAAIPALQDVAARWPSTQAGSAAARLLEELELIGRPAGSLDDVAWFRGEAAFTDAPVTLVLFFEAWCPHCARETPQVQSMAEAWGDRGLGVVGITRRSRGVTEEELAAFLDRGGATFPVGVESGSVSERFAVTGIPAAALVRDGVIIWRGHPGQLDDEVLAAFLPAATP